jgi:hypothetical protein
MRVCGTPLMAPVVRDRIDSGTIYLAGNDDGPGRGDAGALARAGKL